VLRGVLGNHQIRDRSCQGPRALSARPRLTSLKSARSLSAARSISTGKPAALARPSTRHRKHRVALTLICFLTSRRSFWSWCSSPACCGIIFDFGLADFRSLRSVLGDPVYTALRTQWRMNNRREMNARDACEAMRCHRTSLLNFRPSTKKKKKIFHGNETHEPGALRTMKQDMSSAPSPITPFAVPFFQYRQSSILSVSAYYR